MYRAHREVIFAIAQLSCFEYSNEHIKYRCHLSEA